MRVLLLNTAVQRGGGVTATVELATGLAARGADVQVVGAGTGDLVGRLPQHGAVRTLALEGGSPVRALVALARIVRRTRPDVILADRRADVRLAVAARALGPALVRRHARDDIGDPVRDRPVPIVHRYGAPNPLRRDPIVRLVWSRIQALILNSERMRRRLERTHAFLFRRPVVIVPNGKDLGFYRRMPELRARARAELGVPDHAFAVSFHGMLQARKNVDLLIRGAALAATSRPVHVLIAGSGEEEDALKRIAAELGVPTRFAGFRRDVRPLLAAADAAANLSTSEGFANAVVEAMACGLPVIATAGTSHDEQIVHGEHGLLIAAPSAEEVAAALRTLADDDSLRARMGAAARRRAEAEFGLDRMLDRYEAVLRSVVSGVAGAPA